MNNVVKTRRSSKLFGRPVPIRPLDEGRVEVEGVVYERWELAACRGMSDRDLVRYHNNKVDHVVDHDILCGHAAKVTKVEDVFDGKTLDDREAAQYDRLRKVDCEKLYAHD